LCLRGPGEGKRGKRNRPDGIRNDRFHIGSPLWYAAGTNRSIGDRDPNYTID
jgi:hypothetical protein